MKYLELLKAAKVRFGLVFSKRPKKEELERAVAKAAEERRKATDPATLREGATILREMASQFEAEARAAEERAKAITDAQTGVARTTGGLLTALVAFRDAVARLVGLGLDYVYPAPLTAELVEAAIITLTPPKPPLRLYVFWTHGQHQVSRGYILAESFDQAKKRWANKDVNYGQAHPGTCNWPTAVGRCLSALVENDEVVDREYASTLHARTLAGHLYRFQLTGPEYEGLALVSADSFIAAKAKAIAGDVVEGDRPDPEIIPELQKALDALQESGQVERKGHTLTTQTII